jgi:hypothetical protein
MADLLPTVPIGDNTATASFQESNRGEHPFVIGGLSLTVTSAPRELTIGAGEQKMAVHMLVGGGRVIHRTGFQPDICEFTGRARQPDISTIVQQLRRFSVDGKERVFTWRHEHYYGIVRRFSPTYQNGGNRLTWKIAIEVTRDKNGAFSPNAPIPSVDDANNALLETVTVSSNTIAGGIDSTDTTTQAASAANLQAVTATNNVLKQVTPLANASPTGISVASATIQQNISAAQSLVSKLDPLGVLYVPGQQLLSSLNLISSNMNFFQHQTITQQQGGSLYEIAATKYGDIDQAFNLMQANGIRAPRLPGTIVSTIGLPPLASSR